MAERRKDGISRKDRLYPNSRTDTVAFYPLQPTVFSLSNTLSDTLESPAGIA
jgi:hypothetical protein